MALVSTVAILAQGNYRVILRPRLPFWIGFNSGRGSFFFGGIAARGVELATFLHILFKNLAFFVPRGGNSPVAADTLFFAR